MEKERFKLSGETIPTIQEKSIKSLGKRIDRSLRGTIAIQETKDNLEKWLTKVEKTSLRGRFKACIYQHPILAKIPWTQSIYEFTMALIEQKERKIHSCLRRWLELLECISSTALYGHTTTSPIQKLNRRI